jgi:branched-chain amino acid transport system ATP-binding protein
LPGEVIALIGANGAGKSTTLRAISGLIKPTAGDILLDGVSIAGQRPDLIVRNGIAHCPEERHVWPELSVQENLSLGAYICKDRADVRRRTEVVLTRFPRLRERGTQLAGTLSGGEQQMLAIGRALMSAPRILLLDEPSLGLSPMIMQEVLSVIRLLRDQGITIVLVEQNVHNALAVANRAYVFETGKVVAEDSAAGLLKNPELLRAYLGS